MQDGLMEGSPVSSAIDVVSIVAVAAQLLLLPTYRQVVIKSVGACMLN